MLLVIVLIGLQATVEQHFDCLQVMKFHSTLAAVVAADVGVAAAVVVLPVGLALVAGPELVALVDLIIDLHRPN